MKFLLRERVEFGYDNTPYKCRWEIELTNSKKFFCHIGIHKNYFRDDGWQATGNYYSFFLRNEWEIVREHSYYNGPHDWLSLGYLKFAWSGNCEKCYKFAHSNEKFETNLFKIAKLWMKKKFIS